jgi:hypothetical protein
MWSSGTGRQQSGQILANRRPGPAGRGRRATCGAPRLDFNKSLGRWWHPRDRATAAAGANRCAPAPASSRSGQVKGRHGKLLGGLGKAWRNAGRQDVDRMVELCMAGTAGSWCARGWPAAAFIRGRHPAFATKGSRYNSAVQRFGLGRRARQGGARDGPLVPSVLRAAHDRSPRHMARGGVRGVLGHVGPGEGARGASGRHTGRARTPRRQALRGTTRLAFWPVRRRGVVTK